MAYANCHLIEVSIKTTKLNLAVKRIAHQCDYTDVTQTPRFEVITHAKFCFHCDSNECETKE